MNVQFGDSFIKSLKRLTWHQSPIYKAYDFFSDQLPGFIKNVWRFRRELWEHRWWDYRYTLIMLKRSIEILEEGIRTKGHEERESQSKKLYQMKKVIELLQHRLNDNYIDRAEAMHGPLYLSDFKFEETDNGNYALVDEDTEEQKDHNRLVFKTAHNIEEKEWDELWDTLKGTKYKDYKDYDGSNLKTWWD